MPLEIIARPVVDLYCYLGGAVGLKNIWHHFCVTPATGNPQSPLFKVISVRGPVLVILDGPWIVLYLKTRIFKITYVLIFMLEIKKFSAVHCVIKTVCSILYCSQTCYWFCGRRHFHSLWTVHFLSFVFSRKYMMLKFSFISLVRVLFQTIDILKAMLESFYQSAHDRLNLLGRKQPRM